MLVEGTVPRGMTNQGGIKFFGVVLSANSGLVHSKIGNVLLGEWGVPS
jgi:hypothetical protein